jgi:murein DD-endopeptidase MepM/ murein hydrolase activator NlpD
MSYRATTVRQVGVTRRCALLFGILVAFASLGQEQTYVVKSRDTLYDIARRKGVSVSQLANRNRIDRESRIYVGQRLVIPGSAAATTPSSKLSATVRRAIANAPVVPRRWKFIVIHHAAVDEGTVKSLDRYHREQRHMENGLAYHFLIGNGNGMGDGEIAVGDRWKKQLDGGHLHSEAQNKIALGICLIGNFEKYPPSARQMRSLEELVRALLARCKLDAAAAKTHQQVNVVNTKCPGSKFPTRKFLSGLKSGAD